MQTITRKSTKFPGLVLELQASERGTFATFRFGGTFEAFALVGGAAKCVDCSDRFQMPAAMQAHCLTTARAYSERLTNKQTGKALGTAWAA